MIVAITLMMTTPWGSVGVSADPPEMWCMESDGSDCGILYEGDTITIKWDCPAWTVRMEMRAYLSFERVSYYPTDKFFETERDGITLTEGYENIDIPIQNTGYIEDLDLWLSCFDSDGVETQDTGTLWVYPEPDISDNTNGNDGADDSGNQVLSPIILPALILFMILSVVLLIIVSALLYRRKRQEPPQQYQQPPSQ